MTNCIANPIQFSSLAGKKILADFSGGSITSNAGGLLLREADIALQLTNQLSKRLCDRRQDGKINYPLLTLLRQRIYPLALAVMKM